MVIDHYIPVSRWKKLHMKGDVDDVLNYMPSCSSCNYWKGAKSAGGFKKDIRDQYRRVFNESAGFRNLLRYGVIYQSNHPIKFYFEKHLESTDWCEKVGYWPKINPVYMPCEPVTVAMREDKDNANETDEGI